MNLRSLFNKLLPPKKAATSSFNELKRASPNKFSIQFINMEDSPVYQLGETFSVGSEVGDVVIDDPSLSPKHATFHVRNGLVSVIDHASSEGIRLKDALLPKGRAVILEVDDELSLGNIVVRLIGEVDESFDDDPLLRGISEEAQAVEETENNLKEMPKDSYVEKSKEKSISLETTREEITETEKKSEEPIVKAPNIISPTKQKVGFFSKLLSKFKIKKAIKKPSKQANARKTVGGGIHRSANTIPRVFGLVLDGVWSLIVWQILSPLQDFNLFLEVILDIFRENLLPLIHEAVLLSGFEAQVNSVLDSVESITSGLTPDFQIGNSLSLFIVVRLVGTIVLGVSLGDYMAGIRSQDSALWKRGGGFLREVFGFVLFPFIIFDLPALISRRTFKEIISFTTLYVPSKSSFIVSLIFYVPLTLSCLLLSPFIAGLDLPENVSFTEQTKHRKPRRSAVELKVERTEIGSDWFGATFAIDTSKWWIYPKIIFLKEKNIRSLRPTLVFFNQSGIKVPLSLDKRFSWHKLLTPIFSHNIFAQKEFPNIWKFIKSSQIEKNSSLSYRPTNTEKAQFQVELQSLISIMFKLTPETFVEHMQTHGPFIKGYMEARSKFLALVSSKSDEMWSLTQMGKTPFLIHEGGGAKPLQHMIPLVVGNGRIFKISYESNKEKSKNGYLAQGEIWSKSNWQEAKPNEEYHFVKLVDTVSKLARPETLEEGKLGLKTIYGAFFERATEVVTLDATDIKKTSLLDTLDNVIRVLNQVGEYHLKNNTPGDILELEKFLSNLTDIKAQLESGNKAFFGESDKPEKLNKAGQRLK